MAKATMTNWLALSLMAVAGMVASLTATAAPIQEPEIPVLEVTGAPVPESSFRLLAQAGLWYRVSGRHSVDYHGTTHMLTWDLGGYRWDGRSRTWGLAVRGAVDDFGFRAGPKAFMRWPLGVKGSWFIQLGATCYLFEVASDLRDFPGWNGEVEISPSKYVSLALGMEALNFQTYTYDWATQQVGWTPESNTSWYVGAKMGGWISFALTAVLFIAGLWYISPLRY